MFSGYYPGKNKVGIGNLLAINIVAGGGAAGDGHGKDMLDTHLTGSKFWSELNIENHDIETILLV